MLTRIISIPLIRMIPRIIMLSRIIAVDLKISEIRVEEEAEIDRLAAFLVSKKHILVLIASAWVARIIDLL